MSIVRPGDFYHLGHVVTDLDAAARGLTDLYGVRWTTPVEYELGLRFDGTDRETGFTAIYSLEAPHLELIQAAPGTPFTAPSSPAVHHLGYWAQDFGTDRKRLLELGLTEEVVGLDDDGRPWGFAYFTGAACGRIELADPTTFETGWDGFLAARVR